MHLHHKAVISRLELILSDILRGRNLTDWVEETVEQLLESVGQVDPPVKISRELCKLRKITDIRYELGIHPVWGRLEIEDNGFAAVLSPSCKAKGWFWPQFALAHELAHSLFYDIKELPPVNRVYLEPGNRDLELLCRYIAKCFFIPASWLREHIDRYPQLGSPEFSLTILDQLAETFSVPWQIVAERLVEDSLLWNCIVLQFREINQSQTSMQGEMKPCWRLTWQTRPVKGTEKLFIPIGRRMKDGYMKFPLAKGSIAKLITECEEIGERVSTYEKEIPCQVLNSQTTGNLGKFLSGISETNSVLAYIHYEPMPKELSFDWYRTAHKSIVMAFPLQRVDRES